MTITKKPAPPAKTAKDGGKDKDVVAEAFIQAAEHTAPTAAPAATEAKPKKKSAKAKQAEAAPVVTPDAEPAAPAEHKDKKAKDKGKSKEKEKDKGKKKKNKKKEAVIIRFEDAQLQQIDISADALGLSRAAWVRMVVARALGKA